MALSDLLKITQQIDEEKENNKPAASSGGSGSSATSSSGSGSSIFEEEEEESSRPQLTDIRPVAPVENMEPLPDKNPENNKPVPIPTDKPNSGKNVPLVQKPAKKGSVQRPAQSLYQSESEFDKLRKEKWYDGEKPTEVDVVARIYKIAEVDKSYAESFFNDYIGFKEKGSFKETYGTATSSWLGELGIDDPSELNDEIIAGFQKFIAENGVTTASGSLSSSKKNGRNAVLAYQLDQLCNDYFDTKGLLAEQDELYKEISYWVAQGYTNEEIKGKINLSKYNGLNSAKEKTKTGEYTPTTSAIAALTSYGIDGMIYAARNNGGTGDLFTDAVHAKLGRGVNPAVSPEQIARRTPGDKAYAPYAVGTTMHDEAMLFGMTGFDRKWLDENHARIEASGDPKLQQAYGRVYDAVERTEKAEAEAAALKASINAMIANGMEPERIFTDELLDSYPTLKAMYEGQQKLNLVDVAHAVDFDLYAWRNEAEKAYKDYAGTVSAKDYEKKMNDGLGLSTPSYEGEEELDKDAEEQMKKWKETLFYTHTTPAEGAALKTMSPEFARLKAGVSTGISAGTGGYDNAYLADIQNANDYAGKHYLNAVATLAQSQAELDAMTKPVDDFVEKWFKGQDKDEVIRKLANGEMEYPSDPAYQQDYQMLVNTVGFLDTYLEDRTKLEASVANEQQIIDNIAARFASAEELNVSGKPSKSVMPTLTFMEQFYNYDAKADYAEFGDWQYQLEAEGVDWAKVGEELDQRKKNNVSAMENLDIAIAQAEKWGTDPALLDNMRRARDVYELDNKLIDYAKLQDVEGFSDAVKQFDEQEEAKTNWFKPSHENEIKNLVAEYTRLTGKDRPEDASANAEDAFLNYVSVSHLNEDLALKVTLMSDNERDTYKYLYETQGPEAAAKFFDTLDDAHLGSRKSAYREMVTEKRTEQHPVMMNVLSVAASPYQVLGVVEVVTAALTGKEIDPDSDWFAVGQVVGKVREVSQEDIVEHFGEGTTAAKIATFGYQVATSVGDSLAAAPVGGAWTMGLESFANTAMEAAERGADTWDAILLAGITGAAEVATEYLPMGAIEDAFKTGGKEGIKGLLKSMASGLTEAPGEALSELISGAADTLIMDELSNYSQNIQRYIQSGMTPEDAEKQATKDFWKNVGMAGLQGMFAGSGQNTIAYVAGSALNSAPKKEQPKVDAETPAAEPASQEAPATEEQAPAETDQEATTEAEQNAPPFEYTVPVVANQAMPKTEQNAPDNVRMVTALATAQGDGISQPDRTAAVAGVFEAGGLTPEMALAAAKEYAKTIPGIYQLQQSVQNMSDAFTTLKAAAYRVLVPSANADGKSDAEVIATVENDAALTAELDNAVMNSEIATETFKVRQEMDQSAVTSAYDKFRSTKQAMTEAAKRLTLRESDVENTRKALQNANAEMRQNPSDPKLVNRTIEAARNMQQAKKAAEEARIAHENSKQNYGDAKKNLQTVANQQTNEARRIAKERVQQKMEEQRRAAQEQKEAEAQRVAEQNAAIENKGYQKKQFIPYEGKAPENTSASVERTSTVISSDSFAQANSIIENARTEEDGNKGVRTAIKKVFNALFGERFNDIKVAVDNVTFDGQPYVVSVFKNVIGKVISDPGLSAEKMSVLSELEAVIKNASYLTSSAVDNSDQKKGNVLRYDYLSSPVEINGRAYDADLTIEVSALNNKMRTYQIKEIELAPLAPASTGYLPGLVSDEMPTSTDSVPQPVESVNSSVRSVNGENALASGGNPTLTMNPQTQQPSAPVSDIPAPPDGMGVSQFAGQTGQNTNVLSDKVKADLAASPFYKKTTEKENLGKAISNIERDGYDVRKNKLLDGSTNLYTPEGQVEAYVLAKIAKENGDTAGESAIAFRVKESGTLLGQSLAMRRMYVEMTPAGKAQYVQRIVDQYNAEYERLRKDTRIEVPAWLAERLEKASGDEAATEQVLHEAYSAIAEQMPPDWRTRINGYRYLAMLGNSRTHIRNVIGNALFMPAVAVKNKVGAALEKTFNASERTKALGSVKKEYRDFANRQLEDVRDILTGGGKHSPQSEIQQQRRTFNNAKLEWLSKKNSELLEREDAVFLNRHFSNALAGYLQANNVDLANVDDATLQAGLTYAIKEAKKATYRDDSELADKISRFSRDLSTSEKFGSRVAGTVLEGALPFKKTPINVMRRGVEYSPIGLMKALTVDSFKLKNGSITTSEYFDNLASGITGTALAALGFWAYGLGHVKLSLDDKEGELDKLDGSQEYSIEFSLFGNDISYTLDWMSPSAMPFFVGAAIGELTQSDEEVNLRTLYDALQGITEPVFNLSMMEGVNKLLSSASWSENGFIGVIGNALESYATQFVPSTLGAFARTFDKTRRTTYTDKNSVAPSGLQYLWDSTINKIPGLSFTGQPYLNAWGEEDITKNVIVRAIENFLSPGYLNTLSTDDVEQGLTELFDRTGEPGLVPKAPSKYFTVAEERKELTGPEYEQLTKERGQLAKRLHEELFASPEFMAFDDEYKVYALAQVWNYATKTAQHHIDDRVKLTGWMMSTDNPAQSIISETNDKIISDKKDEYRSGIYNAVDSGDYENATTCIQGLKDMGVKNGDIKKSVTTHYKEQYKALYRDGDIEGMYEMRDALVSLGLGYTYPEFEKWLN